MISNSLQRLADRRRLLASMIGMAVGLVAGICAGAGCENVERVRVQGKVMQNGRPIQRNLLETVRLSFLPVEASAKGTIYTAMVDSDGGFELVGENRAGIPLGEYRVAVQIMNPDDRDRLKGAFGPMRSPLVRRVDQSTESVHIDIGKPEG